jgi:hypothetical protein
MEDLADAVAAVLPHHAETVGFRVLLDGTADIAQAAQPGLTTASDDTGIPVSP